MFSSTARYSRASSTASSVAAVLGDGLDLDPQGLAGAGHRGAEAGPVERRAPPRPAARRAARRVSMISAITPTEA